MFLSVRMDMLYYWPCYCSRSALEQITMAHSYSKDDEVPRQRSSDLNILYNCSRIGNLTSCVPTNRWSKAQKTLSVQLCTCIRLRDRSKYTNHKLKHWDVCNQSRDSACVRWQTSNTAYQMQRMILQYKNSTSIGIF